MEARRFLDILESMGGNFITGVPDSLLKPFLDVVAEKYGVSDKTGKHIVAANEGAAVGLAAGHYLATGQPAVVYMQNSGLGNAVNPICSLLHKKVYSIPVIFVIGWRGQPGVKDEPQHIFQGEITLKQLELLEIPYVVVSSDTTDITADISDLRQSLKHEQSVAFVIKKDALVNTYKTVKTKHHEQQNPAVTALTREDALKAVLSISDDFICVCTTGKLSREVYEIRQQLGASHNHDFLTVGSMGHSISIAQAIAREKPDKRVLCLDGDGAMLMHMGSLAVAGICGTDNLVHIVFNNGAHESVGGMPTVCSKLNPAETAETLGYKKCLRLQSADDIKAAAEDIVSKKGPTFIEIICNTESRSDLGRPASTPVENKKELMEYLGSIQQQ